MSERGAGLAAVLILVVVLATAFLVPVDLELGPRDSEAANGMREVLGELPAEPTVLIGFDADVGTYAEIRPTVRSILAGLVDQGATLAIVSLTPEGRALALAERDRIQRLAADARVVDLGYVPGAEAALVRVAGAIDDGGPISAASGPLRLARPALIVVVGGNDLGPRSWVEQVHTRIEEIPIVAVTPTALLPEVEPYRASGQLAALISTPTDGAAYRRDADLGALDGLGDRDGGPPGLAILVGLLAAIAWLAPALARPAVPGMRARPEAEGS
jgi:hypothetical protein